MVRFRAGIQDRCLTSGSLQINSMRFHYYSSYAQPWIMEFYSYFVFSALSPSNYSITKSSLSTMSYYAVVGVYGTWEEFKSIPIRITATKSSRQRRRQKILSEMTARHSIRQTPPGAVLQSAEQVIFTFLVRWVCLKLFLSQVTLLN